METVNIHEAKTHLSRLLERVARGDSVILAKAGKPIARLVPIGPAERAPQQRTGFMAGQLRVPADFDHMGASKIEALFGGQP
jgi:prevent-host-death family protein